MNTLATIICLFVSFVCCEGTKSESYPCNIYGNGLVDGLSGLEADTIATGCPNGVINWSYPRGRLLLIFPFVRNGLMSRVCVETRSTIGNITEVLTQQVLTLTVENRHTGPFLTSKGRGIATSKKFLALRELNSYVLLPYNSTKTHIKGDRFCTPYRFGYYTILEFTPTPSRFLYRASIRYSIEQ